MKDDKPAMTQPILNPVDLQSLLPLLPAEDKFARCLARGIHCKLGNGELPEKEIKSGKNANVVRGEIIRFFAYGGDSDKPVRGPIISLSGAWISGDLDLEHASIPHALQFKYCRFVCRVIMQHAECSALYLDGSHLAHGLTADGLKTKGSVNLRKGFVAEGEVRLLGANVGGHLDCSDGKFCNPGGHALIADGMTAKGNVFMHEGFSAEGAVQLLGANVGGALNCSGGEFCNPGGYALSADGLTTKDDVFLSSGFSAEGEVRLWGANVGGSLPCAGGKFNNPKGYALVVEGGNINGYLIWQNVQGEGFVHLGNAKVSVLADDANSWKPFEIILDGFTHNSFASPVDAQSLLDWLGNRPQKEDFSPQPYEQVAKVLFGMGHNKDAREILLEKERLQTKDERTSWYHKIGRCLWDVFAGYGYRLRYTVAWMAGFVIAGMVLFGTAAHHGQIVPHQPPILSSEKYRGELAKGLPPMESVRTAFPEYPEFSPLAYSLDVFIPFFALHQEPFWNPASGGDNDLCKASLLLVLFVTVALVLVILASQFANWIRRKWGDSFTRAGMAGVGMAAILLFLVAGFVVELAHFWLDFNLGVWLADWRWLTVWHWLEIGAGWVLTSLFLLSVTGLLRPRQSSGERS